MFQKDRYYWLVHRKLYQPMQRVEHYGSSSEKSEVWLQACQLKVPNFQTVRARVLNSSSTVKVDLMKHVWYRKYSKEGKADFTYLFPAHTLQHALSQIISAYRPCRNIFCMDSWHLCGWVCLLFLKFTTRNILLYRPYPNTLVQCSSLGNPISVSLFSLYRKRILLVSTQ